MPRTGPPSVPGGLVEDDGEADDPAVPDAEVARHDQLLRQVCLVVGAVVAGSDDGVAVVVNDLDDLHGHMVTHKLLRYEPADGVDSLDLAAVVVHVGIRGEGGHNALGVKGVYGGDVFSDYAGHVGGGHMFDSSVSLGRSARPTTGWRMPLR